MNSLKAFKLSYIINFISSAVISGDIFYLLVFRRYPNLIPNIFSISLLYCLIYFVLDFFCAKLHYVISSVSYFTKKLQVMGCISCIISFLSTIFLFYKMAYPVYKVYSLPFFDYFIDYILIYIVFAVIATSLYMCLRFWQLIKIVNTISNETIEMIGKE